MKWTCVVAFATVVAVSACVGVSADDNEKSKTFEVYGGWAHNFDTPLDIEQTGQPGIDITADYETRPFESPLYYVVRYGVWRGDRGT